MIPGINLAVIGHLDHGKSTLIGRLLYDSGSLSEEKIKKIRLIAQGLQKTGKANRDLEFAFFLDSLREERVNGLTLDTTQVRFRTNKFRYNLIDCPGHKQFIKNMLTGSSQAQAAILVVSAKLSEGIQEQTKAHILLAGMLGIKQLFVAVNKMDLVQYNRERFKQIRYKIDRFLKAVNCYKHASFIPIAAKKGDNLLHKSANMNWYRGKPLVDLLNKQIKMPAHLNSKALRVLIQDIYGNKGRRIIVGRIESGTLRQNEKLFLNLSQQAGRVTAIIGPEGSKKKAIAGECVSFRVSSIDYDRITRGEVGSSLDDFSAAKKTFFARIFIFNRNLYKNDKLTIKCGIAERNCRIEKIIENLDYSSLRTKKQDSAILEQNDILKVKLAVDKPIVVERFSKFPSLGRFILIKKDKICAFGIVK